MTIETEVKIHLPDFSVMQPHLRAATLKMRRTYERNLRYDNAEGTLTPNDIVLRLRQDQHNKLTYKAPAGSSDGIISRVELETQVADFDMAHAILQALGFSVYMVYEKYRTAYQLGGCEIVLDEMPYGNFIEIEGTAGEIETLLTQFGLQNAHRINASYADLFDHIKAALGLTFRDLTFENFEGIEVDEPLLRR